LIPLFKVFTDEGAAVANLSQAIHSGYLGEGERVKQFERMLGNLLGSPTLPVAVNSGTSAIDLALHLAGVGPGDEVITTPMTCMATNVHIIHRGARIVWADVDKYTGLIDVADAARKITPRTKALIGVDWGGAVCDYAGLMKVCRYVVRDAAHSLLTKPKFDADLTCYSFQAIKHLTCGDGGALVCHWVPGGDRARLLRWYGLDRNSGVDFRCSQDVKEAGFKYHMNDIAASIGLANLPHARQIVAKHRANAAYYNDRLYYTMTDSFRCPLWDADSSWWLYTLLVEDRAGFIAYMGEKGIHCSPVHRRNDEMHCFASSRTSLPGVDFFAARNVAIPVGWWLTEEQREYIAQAVLDWRG
jgi:perosamine synthetase